MPPRPSNPDNLTTGQPGYLIVNTDNLNIRSGDGPEYTVVGVVDGGTELIVLGRNENRTWWYVQVADIKGWVIGELSIVRGDLTNIPVVPVLGEVARPSLYVFVEATLFTIPVEGALGVCQIAGDRDYYVIGRTVSSVWLELEATCDGATVTGWVKAELGGLRNAANSFIPVTD
ncbi:MAG: SH3 domain-containing protein [Armatimonadetes bacterium]|nr:SH3 domain-containing protein [Anaerolineae bacterium]